MNQNKEIPSRAEKKKQKSSRRFEMRMLILVFLVVIIIFSFFGCTKLLGVEQWKDFDPDKLINVKQTSFLYDDKDQLIAGIHGKENRIKVTIDKIPLHVQNAFIAVEDVRFREHKGIDIKRIFGAIIEDIKAGSYIQGASTISQQLIKNSHLTNQKTISRKLQEMYLAYQLERNYTKDQILEMYLNFIYFGNGAYGIEAASRTYFGKSVSDLTIAEGALLAGIPKSPSKYAPHINLEDSIERRNLVLDLMVKYEFITNQDAEKAKKEEVNLIEYERGEYPFGYYVDQVIHDAAEILKIEVEELLTGGYKIYTALDQDLQQHCEALYTNDELFPPDMNGQKVESALVVLDPKTAEVKVLIGGRERKTNRGLNFATQLIRQPGSAIKPIIVYSPAIDRFQYSPTTFILDEPVTFNDYTPSNYGGKFYGWVTLRDAVARSINIPAVKTLDDIGIESGKDFARNVGISFDPNDNYLGLALGGFTHGVTPITLCNAYLPLANDGKYSKYTLIRSIEGPTGEVLYKHEPQWRQVMSPESAFIMTNILQSVIESGTATRLKSLGIPLAGKTGTVDLDIEGISGNKDAWMVAYNPDYLATIWMGFEKTSKEHYLSTKVTGGSYPAGILQEFFRYVYKDKNAPNFIKPSGVIEAKLDAKSLWERREVLLANSLTPDEFIITEYFTENTVPVKETNYWIIPQPPDDVAIELSDDNLPVISFTPKNTFVLYNVYRQEEMSAPLLIEQVTPSGYNRLNIKDRLAVAGHTYEYYIIPVHPEIILDNKALEGPSSSRVSINLPLPVVPPLLEQPGENQPDNLPDDNTPPQENNDDIQIQLWP